MPIDTRGFQYGKVFGNWQIKKWIAGGSNGRTGVYQIYRNEAGWEEKCALKVITLISEHGDREKYSSSRRADYKKAMESRYQQAAQEVRTMAQLRGNTNIVDYLDFSSSEWVEDNAFGCDLLIRMELLHDLRTELKNGRSFTEAEIIKIGKDICNALILCHGKNIIHRDIKPENIFYNDDGNYKLGDFGISRIMDACPGAMASTGIGTPEYAAPEQGSGRYDKRVDIYSLGLVLYELSNQNWLPFATSTYLDGSETVQRLSGKPLPPPRYASPELTKVILKACAFKASNRYQSAEDFLSALNALVPGTKKQSPVRKKSSDIAPAVSYETVPASGDTASQSKSAPHVSYETMPATPANNVPPSSENRRKKRREGKEKITQQSKTPNAPKPLTIQERERLAENGTADEQFRLGLAYDNGDGIPQNYERALYWYEKAAAGGSAAAMNNIGWIHACGHGVPKSDSMATHWYRKAAEAGSAIAQKNLGVRYYKGGLGVNKDYKEAEIWFSKAAKNGNAIAQYYLGEIYYYGHAGQTNRTRAFQYYKQSANNGDADAQYSLAFCYKNGHGTNRNAKKAAIWFYKAANNGSTAAKKAVSAFDVAEIVAVADCLYYGTDVEVDLPQAVIWYQKAANAGNAYAASSLHFCFINGKGVEKNLATALLWAQTAAQTDDFYARSLGDCYYNGWGVKKDIATAINYYEKAAKAGNQNALRRLGDCYSKGIGVEKDLINAMNYYREAIAKNDFDAAQSYLHILAHAKKSDKVLLEQSGHNASVVSADITERIQQANMKKKKDTKGTSIVILGWIFALCTVLAGMILWFCEVPFWVCLTVSVSCSLLATILLGCGDYYGDQSTSFLEELLTPEGAVATAFVTISIPIITAIIITVIEGVIWCISVLF